MLTFQQQPRPKKTPLFDLYPSTCVELFLDNSTISTQLLHLASTDNSTVHETLTALSALTLRECAALNNNNNKVYSNTLS